MVAALSVGFAGPASAAPEVTSQQGYAVECSGANDGYTAYVSLYQNTLLDAPVTTAMITTSDGSELGGQATSSEDVFSGGSIDVDFALLDL